MSEYKILLTVENLSAAEDALRVFDLYDLKHDMSYPFLNNRKWQPGHPDYTYDDWGKRVEQVSERAYRSFMLVDDLGLMKKHVMGYAVAELLRRALSCLTQRNKPVIIARTLGHVAFMGCVDESPADNMTAPDVAVQTAIFLVHERSEDVMNALRGGNIVHLLPPSQPNQRNMDDEIDHDENDSSRHDEDAGNYAGDEPPVYMPQEQFNWLMEQQRHQYSDALIRGMPNPMEALSIMSEPDSPEPAALVAPNILAEHETGFRIRYLEENGVSGINDEERQGYVDALSLYMVICFAVANEIPLVLADTSSLPGFNQLPFEVRANAGYFIEENVAWASKMFRRNDLYDGRGFMNELVNKVADEQADADYQRGVKTARDTLLLYVDFIVEFS